MKSRPIRLFASSHFWVMVVLASIAMMTRYPFLAVYGMTIQAPQPASEGLLTLLSNARQTKQALPLMGVYDALSARILQKAFHDNNNQKVALFVSGFGVSAARLGVPDAGIWTRNDLVDTVQHILLSNPSGIVIADGDTGFGGTSNIRQTIRQMAALGVAAITIEDQTFPKKCTYVAGMGVTVVNQEEAVQRIKTALAAQKEVYEQTGTKVLIIARTDCRMQLGLDQAITRCVEFEALGADICYAENLQSPDEYQKLRNALSSDTPMMLAQVQNAGSAHQYTLQDIGSMGYEMGLFGVTGLQAAVAALQQVAKAVVQGDGLISPTKGSPLASLEEIKDIVGFNDLEAFEENYGCS